MNLAVWECSSRVVTWLPIEPSVDPIASNSTTCGIRSSRASFTSVVHMTPDDTIIFSDDASYASPRSAASSTAAMIGFANESPTMVLCVQRWCWIVPISSCASRLRLVSVITWPPIMWCIRAPNHRPVPCISGAPVTDTGVAPASASARTDGAMSSAVGGAGSPAAE